jgi:tRNA(Ile)-lysidine synthase
MPHALPEHLWATIDHHLPAAASGDLLVAFSGGLDSTVLLHALASGDASQRQRLRAVHVDHQLHPEAPRWQEHCARVALALAVPFLSERVSIATNPREGVESAARSARYEALRRALRPGETLVTAHHADDQLETVLLALLRGSGVDGLAAMPRCQRFGSGWHLRPMLDCTREDMVRWANEQHIVWLDDPSNDNTRFDRNYLRSEVVPRLRERWPSIARSAVRSAGHLGEAAHLLDEIAAHDFAAATIGPCLKVSALKHLDPPRRRNLLRYWLHTCGARAPSTRKLAALEHDMLAAQEDRSPCIDWDGIEVRRHRGLLYCVPRRPAADATPIEWAWSLPVHLDAHSGLLRAEIAHGRGLARSKLPERVRITHRHGGESLRLPGRAHHRPLKKLLQEANVLPWWRDRLPLVFAGDALLAVADLWINADYAADSQEEGVSIVWEQRPQIEGMATAR